MKRLIEIPNKIETTLRRMYNGNLSDGVNFILKVWQAERLCTSSDELNEVMWEPCINDDECFI